MTKRPTAYCYRCESTVYADDVHSCYDAKRVRSVAGAERRVVEAAEAWVDATDHYPHGPKLEEAVRELRRVRGDHA